MNACFYFHCVSFSYLPYYFTHKKIKSIFVPITDNLVLNSVSFFIIIIFFLIIPHVHFVFVSLLSFVSIILSPIL